MLFSERYKYDPLKDVIGAGGFSKIYKAYDSLREETVALKFFSGEVKERYGIVAEAKRLLKLSHINVIRFYDLETVEFTNFHNVPENILIGVLEYIEGNDLKWWAKQKLTNEQKLQVTMGLLDGLKYIHSKNLIHRDLKPGNVMLKIVDGQIIPKLIDFGISKQTGENTSSSSQLLGTVEYMAPEQFNPTKYGKVSTATDLWSFGVMIYELYSGKRLFGSRGGGQQTEEVISKILLEEIELDFTGIPENIKKLLIKCLVRNAIDRPRDIGQLTNLLTEAKHPIKERVLKNLTSSVNGEVQSAEVEIKEELPNNTSQLEVVEDVSTKDAVVKVIESPIEKKSIQKENKSIDQISSSISFDKEAVSIIRQGHQSEDKKKGGKKGLWLFLGATLLIIICLFYWNWNSKEKQVEMPDIIHVPYRNAVTILNKLGLESKLTFMAGLVSNLSVSEIKVDGMNVEAGQLIPVSSIVELVVRPHIAEDIEVDPTLKQLSTEHVAEDIEVDPTLKQLSTGREFETVSLKGLMDDEGNEFDYYGETLNNIPEGNGVATYSTGGTYDGEWVGGRASGHGTTVWTNGNKYIGQTRNGRSHGQGTLTSLSGTDLVGIFKDDLFSGTGTLVYPDGEKYVGRFRDSKQHGKGTAFYKNGNKFIGKWSNGEKSQGVFTWLSGKKFEGDFIEGDFGVGTIYFTNGDEWTGNYYDYQPKSDYMKLIDALEESKE